MYLNKNKSKYSKTYIYDKNENKISITREVRKQYKQ